MRVNVLIKGTVFLELWKRTHRRLQYEWHVYKMEGKEPVRPQFNGKLKQVLWHPVSISMLRLLAFCYVGRFHETERQSRLL